jgi:hypothetical protein
MFQIARHSNVSGFVTSASKFVLSYQTCFCVQCYRVCPWFLWKKMRVDNFDDVKSQEELIPDKVNYSVLRFVTSALQFV